MAQLFSLSWNHQTVVLSEDILHVAGLGLHTGQDFNLLINIPMMGLYIYKRIYCGNNH